MDIQIDSKAIQEAVVRAIADSSIGDLIQKNINKILTETEGFRGTSILEKSMNEEIKRLIVLILREQMESHKDKIKELVVPLITDEVISRMGSSVIEVMIGNLSHR